MSRSSGLMRLCAMRRLIATVCTVLTVGGLGLVTQLAAGADASGVPDEVMLRSDDLDGAAPAPGGPDRSVHPLPPRPCADSSPPAPTADRVINARFGSYQVYEYVARYPVGQAEQVVDELRAQLVRCARPAEGERYQVLAEDSAGVLFLREYNGGDPTSAYYVGHTDHYLVAVLEIGTRTPNGDPTTASDLGRKALLRAGGSVGTPVSPSPSTGSAPWTVFQAPVTGVRPGPDPRTLLLDVELLAGQPDCARNPRVDQYTEENGVIYANVVMESARAHVVGGCPGTAPAVITMTAPEPFGDRIVVLNHEPWAPAGGAGRPGCSAPRT